MKPTTPPAGSNLVVANWDGQPIPFGDEVITTRTRENFKKFHELYL